MSALPPKADMCGGIRDVRFGPKADTCGAYGRVALAPKRTFARRRFLKGDDLRFAHLPARPAGQDDSARSALLIV